MQPATLKEKMNLSNAKALRRAREMMKVTRLQMATKLNLSLEAIKKYESGRAIIDEDKINKWLLSLELNKEDFKKIKKGKGIPRGRKVKTVVSNSDRRSYKRIITKEVRVLKILRQMKNLTQDQASAICGYSRPSIGHIENGRITLDQNRIEHVVESYGHSMSEFHRLMKEEILRDEVLKFCHDKLILFPDEKLKLVQSMILSLS
jgi:transcriptional regulator with XRE-family HTH domain